MMNPEFDPLRDLNELKHHAKLVEMHIANLIANERVMIDEINKIQDKIQLLEEKINANTREK